MTSVHGQADNSTSSGDSNNDDASSGGSNSTSGDNSTSPSGPTSALLLTAVATSRDSPFNHIEAITTDLNEFEGGSGSIRGIVVGDNSQLVFSCDTDYETKELYYFNYATRSVHLFENFSVEMNRDTMNHSVFQAAMSEAFVKIAVDWVNHNVYIADTVTGNIYLKKGGRNDDIMAHHILIKDIDRPRGIAVDPVAGYVFWSSKIEDAIGRMSLIGENPIRKLGYGNIKSPDGLALDVKERLIYWVDNQHIMSMTYEGTHRNEVFKYSYASFYDLTFYQNILVATDVGGWNHLVKFIDPVTKTELIDKTLSSGVQDYYGLCSYMERPMPPPLTGKVMCPDYGCQEICVNQPNQVLPTCLCRDGYKLKDDLKTCEADGYPYHRGIIVNTGTQFCMIGILAVSEKNTTVPTCFFTTGSVITHFDIDMKNRDIYFSIGSAIHRVAIDSGAAKLDIVGATGEVTGITYNWASKLLYYSVAANESSSLSTIWSINIETADAASLVSSMGEPPRALTVAPHEGKLFYIQYDAASGYDTVNYLDINSGEYGTIESESNLVQSSAMAHDVKFERLYVLDEKYSSYYGWYKEIVLMEYNGTDSAWPLDIYTETLAFASYKDYVLYGYLTDEGVEIESVDVLYPGYVVVVEKLLGLTGLREMKVIDVEGLQPEYPDPCGKVKKNGGCEHICRPQNFNSSTCACKMGYTLVNETRCDTTILTDNFILFSDETYHELLTISLDAPSDVYAIRTPTLSRPTGVIYEYDRQLIYSTSDNIGDILAMSTNGTVLFRISDGGNSYPDRFAYDPSSKLLYYTAYTLYASWDRDSYIGAIDTKGQDNILYYGAHYPRSIVLHPERGIMFYTDHGSADAYNGIIRMNMDGTGWQRIVSDEDGLEIRWPNGLAIDYAGNKLYWADGYYDTIRSCDYDGGNDALIFKEDGAHLQGLKFVNGYLYYTAWNNLKIKKIKIDNTSDVTEFGPEHSLGLINELDVYISGTTDQIPINTACANNNGGCSDFCFPAAGGRVCGCSWDSSLLRDNRTCDNVPRCPPILTTASVPETDTCLLIEGHVCNFECITNYRPKAGVSSITCTSEADPDFDNRLLWDNDDPCEEIFCPMTVPNGQLNLTACSRKVDSECVDYFTCNAGYEKNMDIDSLTCLVSGSWDITDPLCIPRCPELTSTDDKATLHRTCNRDIAESCRFVCDEKYKPAVNYSRIVCQTGSAWNVSTDTLCEEIICTDIIEDGFIDTSNCTRKLGASCGYMCDTRFEPNQNIPTITCQGMGVWSHVGTDNVLCTLIQTEVEKSTSEKVAIGVGVGAGVLILLIIIVLIVLYRTGRLLGTKKHPPVSITSFDNPRYNETGLNLQPTGSQADRAFSYATLDEEKVDAPNKEHVYDNPIAKDQP